MLLKKTGSGAPGWVYPHYRTANETGVMSVFVCGDGAENFYQFSPHQNSWTQSFEEGYGGTVGDVAWFDYEGTTMAFVSDYSNDLIHIYRYQ